MLVHAEAPNLYFVRQSAAEALGLELPDAHALVPSVPSKRGPTRITSRCNECGASWVRVPPASRLRQLAADPTLGPEAFAASLPLVILGFRRVYKRFHLSTSHDEYTPLFRELPAPLVDTECTLWKQPVVAKPKPITGRPDSVRATLCGSDASADDAFVQAVTASRDAAACGPGSFERIDKLARLLSAAAAGGCPRFGYHGFWGVFSEPRRSDYKIDKKAATRNYGSAKSSFMFNQTCAHARASPGGLAQICEIGFNAGHTALLFLETAPTARVVSFDLGEYPWANKQAALLTRAYGAARFQAVFGSSDATVPPYASRLPSKCDVSFSDGGKTETMRSADLRNMRKLSQPNALLLFDEVSTLACVRGEGERERSCGDLATSWYGTSYAYYTASREGWLNIESCAWPPGLEDRDGICSGRYVATHKGGGAAHRAHVSGSLGT